MPTHITLNQGSLTEGDESVLVNASNTQAQLGSGVSAAIRAACGRGYQARVFEALQHRFGGPMQPGEVLMTDAGEHPRARHVAHVAVMDYRDGFNASSYPTADVIRTGCERLWDEVERLPESGVSVAMVALGAGTGNLGVVEPTRIACETLKAHLALHTNSRLARVTFYGYELHEYLAMASELVRHFPELAASLPDEVRAYLR
ncbi:hypothetical protein HPC49_02775 [Pyxidicoccus fallax]|uniref:Macro domain-containing protein n=1 Tax=Pyxidicoccus fallax TaxID=394095 RepID=A0A848L9C6_9BACT|nr:macro domain-containing protein [Pyxidicoccus fallax]NMO13273.1 hypothetical protein [Pyxidicoccus fallax]NPC77179.1 hypothetical protein [Pyxidicoccus fallax]